MYIFFSEILTVGGDPCIKNHLLQTPYAATPHHDTRIAFRLFQAKFPEKYNYNKVSIKTIKKKKLNDFH